MENSISPTSISNFVTTVVINIDFRVWFNLFFYSTAVTSGILTASKVVTFLLEQLISFIRYKWADRYQRKMEEIRELNIKMHDRLVEMEYIINGGKVNQKSREARMRLLYNASRLKKYDETVFNNVNELIGNVSFKENGEMIIENIPRAKILINEIRVKIDKLWFG